MRTLPPDLQQQVANALSEDIGAGDVTAGLVPASQRVRGKVITREDAVFCGRPWVTETFRRLDPNIQLTWHVDDGDRITSNQTLFEISGLARPVLSGERTALNFVQLLSATATAARRYSDAIAGTGCAILDTRKTIPGLRTAQKYAVRCGGAQNYRIGLFDHVLIKENHIAAAGSITAAVTAGRRAAGSPKVEVEVETLAEFEEALRAQPDIIMLDEFSVDDMRSAVAVNKSKDRPVELEASGSVTLETVRSVAETGVDYISIGGITKHIKAVDLSMRLEFA
jgi:nicotinate-nucleotide pyrophosphorylase (carboxylating)